MVFHHLWSRPWGFSRLDSEDDVHTATWPAGGRNLDCRVQACSCETARVSDGCHWSLCGTVMALQMAMSQSLQSGIVRPDMTGGPRLQV